MYKAYLSNDTQLMYPEKVTVSLTAVAFYRSRRIQLCELVYSADMQLHQLWNSERRVQILHHCFHWDYAWFCLEWLDLIFSVPKSIYPAVRAEGRQHGLGVCDCLTFFDGNIGKRKVAEAGLCELKLISTIVLQRSCVAQPHLQHRQLPTQKMQAVSSLSLLVCPEEAGSAHKGACGCWEKWLPATHPKMC